MWQFTCLVLALWEPGRSSQSSFSWDAFCFILCPLLRRAARLKQDFLRGTVINMDCKCPEDETFICWPSVVINPYPDKGWSPVQHRSSRSSDCCINQHLQAELSATKLWNFPWLAGQDNTFPLKNGEWGWGEFWEPIGHRKSVSQGSGALPPGLASLYLTISYSLVIPANQISIIMRLLWVCLLPEI